MHGPHPKIQLGRPRPSTRKIRLDLASPIEDENPYNTIDMEDRLPSLRGHILRPNIRGALHGQAFSDRLGLAVEVRDISLASTVFHCTEYHSKTLSLSSHHSRIENVLALARISERAERFHAPKRDPLSSRGVPLANGCVVAEFFLDFGRLGKMGDPMLRGLLQITTKHFPGW
jgi:hypothetical protein